MKPGDKLGRYEIERPLARGGMAEVWLAMSRGVGGFAKRVVLKTILPDLAENPDFVRMFINEALLAARLNHPNIVQIFDLGQIDGRYFIAMEYVPGRTLRQISRRCRKKGQLIPPWFVLRALAIVADGLQYAHDQRDDQGNPLGLVHRDITPENIMIAFTGTVKILDFGVAKATAAAPLTRAGTLKGKYAYVSPEQVHGAPADRRSDVYSVGVMLYELLTGSRPFRGKNDLDLLRRVAAGNATPARELAPWIPEEFDTTVMKALATKPELRFSAASRLGEQLLAFLKRAQDHRGQREMGLFVSGIYPDDPNIPSDILKSIEGRPDDSLISDLTILSASYSSAAEGADGSLASLEAAFVSPPGQTKEANGSGDDGLEAIDSEDTHAPTRGGEDEIDVIAKKITGFEEWDIKRSGGRVQIVAKVDTGSAVPASAVGRGDEDLATEPSGGDGDVTALMDDEGGGLTPVAAKGTPPTGSPAAEARHKGNEGQSGEPREARRVGSGVAETKTDEVMQAVPGQQSAGLASKAPPSSGAGAAGATTSAPKTTSKPKVAGPKVAGPKVAGPKVAGPKVAGPKVAGPKVAGPKVAPSKLPQKPRTPSVSSPTSAVAKAKPVSPKSAPQSGTPQVPDPQRPTVAPSPPERASRSSSVFDTVSKRDEGKGSNRFLDGSAGRPAADDDPMEALWTSTVRPRIGDDRMASLWSMGGSGSVTARGRDVFESAGEQSSASENPDLPADNPFAVSRTPGSDPARDDASPFVGPGVGGPTEPESPEQRGVDVFAAGSSYSSGSADDDVFTSFAPMRTSVRRGMTFGDLRIGDEDEAPSGQASWWGPLKGGAANDRAREAAASWFGRSEAEPDPDQGRGSDQAPEIGGVPGADERSEAAQLFEAGLQAMRDGQLDIALEAWERAVQLAPDNRTYRSNLRLLAKRSAPKP